MKASSPFPMTPVFCVATASVLSVLSAVAQTSPGAPEDNGLTPKTPTTYINLPSILNNGSTESLGVAIGKSGNVMVGWEDDSTLPERDSEAVWTMYDSSGVSITPDTRQTSLEPTLAGRSMTNKFLSYFRSDGSATWGRSSWGPKIKANLFGDGFGMGATSFYLGTEVPEFSAIQIEAGGGAGDFPSVQLLTATGGPVGIVSGMTDTDAQPPGDVRIGDWEYLSDGNVVIVGESRQGEDWTNRFGMLAGGGNVAVYRIVTPAGVEVKGYSKVAAAPNRSEIWHGLGVTANGFAVRFHDTVDGRAKVRMFDNAGNPTTADIDLATLTTNAIAGGGGRGDGVGFHGNGQDAYVTVNSGVDDQGQQQVWVTVLNTNGTLRYSKALTDDLTLTGAERVDGAIAPDGRVLAVFGDAGVTGTRLIMGRLLGPAGNPLGRTFYVSELETPTSNSLETRRPRVAWRGELAAIVWQSRNSPETQDEVVAMRLFSTGGVVRPTLAASRSGGNVLVSWPTSITGFTLEETSTLTNPSWTPVSGVVNNSVSVTAGTGNKFYRLSQ